MPPVLCKQCFSVHKISGTWWPTVKSDKEVYSYTLSSKHEEEAQWGETIPEGAYNSDLQI